MEKLEDELKAKYVNSIMELIYIISFHHRVNTVFAIAMTILCNYYLYLY